MNWDRSREDIEGLQCWSCEGQIIYGKIANWGNDDDDDQFDGYDRKVGHMRNTLVTESDVTSSMMGEMYRQLASAQLRGKLYKTGIERQELFLEKYKLGLQVRCCYDDRTWSKYSCGRDACSHQHQIHLNLELHLGQSDW